MKNSLFKVIIIICLAITIFNSYQSIKINNNKITKHCIESYTESSVIINCLKDYGLL
jgi:hypothetical protein